MYTHYTQHHFRAPQTPYPDLEPQSVNSPERCITQGQLRVIEGLQPISQEQLLRELEATRQAKLRRVLEGCARFHGSTDTGVTTSGGKLLTGKERVPMIKNSSPRVGRWTNMSKRTLRRLSANSIGLVEEVRKLRNTEAWQVSRRRFSNHDSDGSATEDEEITTYQLRRDCNQARTSKVSGNSARRRYDASCTFARIRQRYWREAKVMISTEANFTQRDGSYKRLIQKTTPSMRQQRRRSRTPDYTACTAHSLPQPCYSEVTGEDESRSLGTLLPLSS